MGEHTAPRLALRHPDHVCAAFDERGAHAVDVVDPERNTGETADGDFVVVDVAGLDPFDDHVDARVENHPTGIERTLGQPEVVAVEGACGIEVVDRDPHGGNRSHTHSA